jgi:hypothetical protein
MLFLAWRNKISGGVTGEFTKEDGMSIHSISFGLELSPVEVADLWDAASALTSYNPRVEYGGWTVSQINTPRGLESLSCSLSYSASGLLETPPAYAAGLGGELASS